MTNNVFICNGKDAEDLIRSLNSCGEDELSKHYGWGIFIVFDEDEDVYIYFDNRKEKPLIERFVSFDEVSSKLYELT